MKNSLKCLITKREKEVLVEMGKGLTNREIAHNLYISTNTVDTHRKNLLSKLQARNAMQLGIVAQRMGLLG